MSRDISTLTVAITGGARGIGLAAATRLARAGARVVVGDRDVEVAARAVAGAGIEVLPPQPVRWTSWSTTPGSCRSVRSSRSPTR
jgi:NAD(P)-dependent dehydrogenase (short-subunit alcohol dehydrogenase family)